MRIDSKCVVTILSTLLISGVVTASEDRTFEYRGKTYTYDDAMRMSAPPEGIAIVKGVDGCSERVEGVLSVPYRIFELLNQMEGGKNGLAVLSESKDGRYKSWDVGRYQINEINWKQYSGNLTPFDLRWNDCANMIAAAYRMKPFYIEATKIYKSLLPKGNLDAIIDETLFILAGYNSETPAIRAVYRDRMKAHLVRYVLEGKLVSLW